MSRNVVIALVVMALLAVLLIFNTSHKVEVNLLIDQFKWMAALVYLAFVAVGVVIGILLK
jgi:uncharacterized integral membrane protein